MMRRAIWLLAAAQPAAVAAQEGDPVARLAAVRDGEVRFSYATVPEVCGDGDDRIGWGNSSFGSFNSADGWHNWQDRCVPGPARVTLRRRSGETVTVRVTVGQPAPALGDATDWGRLSTANATRVLMHVAETSSGRPAQRAMLAAAIADSAVIWPRLLSIARNDDRPRSARNEARFWLSRIAAEHAIGPKVEPSVGKKEDPRHHAVFALSQQPRGSGIPDLITIAKTHRDAEIRRRALFWLGQEGDERALALFQALLEGPAAPR